jgi:hypothetical protein
LRQVVRPFEDDMARKEERLGGCGSGIGSGCRFGEGENVGEVDACGKRKVMWALARGLVETRCLYSETNL